MQKYVIDLIKNIHHSQLPFRKLWSTRLHTNTKYVIDSIKNIQHLQIGAVFDMQENVSAKHIK